MNESEKQEAANAFDQIFPKLRRSLPYSLSVDITRNVIVFMAASDESLEKQKDDCRKFSQELQKKYESKHVLEVLVGVDVNVRLMIE
mmetsp:Transcript_11516/g.13095  ORF Transcript_11516/g.13095 Transcript_11516/m.13095 type:complete len:87 (-) Transcript_11516:604-864(-)